jgi:hypothetical protein
MILLLDWNILHLFILLGKSVKKKILFSMTAEEQWVNCLDQEQNDRFLPCQLRDLIQLPLSYLPNTLTTRLPAASQSSSNRHIPTSTVQRRLRESGLCGRIAAKCKEAPTKAHQ